jgi:processive 1,2-diacylglycerol beta-glucosyltransferase
MKVLLLSCNTGQGHNTAARALSEAMAENGIECELRDALAFGSERTSRIVSGTYIGVATKTPRLCGSIYSLADKISKPNHKSPVYFANTFLADDMGDYIAANGFDTVVSTHLFPAEVLTYLRGRRGLYVKSYAVATDYTCTPFWEETDIDQFFIPHADLRPEYEQKGFSADRLTVSGIPVSARFAVKYGRDAARAQLGLSQNGKIYLVMTGSMGFGHVLELLSRLLDSCQNQDTVLVMTGRNDTLRADIISRFGQDARVRAIPFTTEVAMYMDACDVLLSKPGGLSSTEAAVKGVPFVHTAPIPGCETCNADFFSAHGMSIATYDAKSACAAAVRLSETPAARAHMLAAQSRNVNAGAAQTICHYLMEDSTQFTVSPKFELAAETL